MGLGPSATHVSKQVCSLVSTQTTSSSLASLRNLSVTAIMAESPSQSGAQLTAHQAESDLASLVFEMSQQVQVGMENMLKLVNEIDGNSVGIKEEIEKSKEFAMEKKRVLEEEKEQFQKAAYTILDMLSNRV